MARSEVTGRKVTDVARVEASALDDADAYSVEEFCRRHRISIQLFYKLKNQMPDTFSIGRRRLISREAAARWRAEREAEAAAKITPTPTPDGQAV